MGLFGFGKKDKVIDLGEKLRKKEDQTREGFFENSASNEQDSDSPEAMKKKIAKRLIDLTNKIEELSNQLYHLQQRVELLERKSGVRAGA